MAINKTLQAQARKQESKSAGMRVLLEGGATVSEAADFYDAPYGFAYGVARRAGLVTSTPRAAKAAAPKTRAAKATTAKASGKTAKAAPPRTARTSGKAKTRAKA